MPSPRRPSPLTRMLSVLAVPIAPVYAAVLSYLVYHPPRRRHHRGPADVGLDASEVRIPMPGRRGASLHVWLCPGARDRVVVVGHGIGLSKSASLAQARFLHEAGYTVALFDLRNHGESGQDRAWWGLSGRFTSDVAAVVAHLRGLPEYAAARYAVYGFSFSTFPVFYLPSRADVGVDAIVCDSGPALDIPRLLRGFLDTKGVPVPRPLRVRPARGGLEAVFARLGTRMLGADWPPPGAPYAGIPVLFLAGEDDTVVPPEAVRELADRYPSVEFVQLPDTEHLQGVKSDPEGYRKHVLEFLHRVLG